MADPAEALGLEPAPPHEYGGGTPTRWTEPWSDNLVRLLTAVGALIVGFLLAAGLSAGRTAAIVQDARKVELIELINERQERADALAAELDILRQRVAEAEAVALAGAPALKAAVAEAEAAAGLTAVRGPGLRLTLSDASDGCPQRPIDCRIQDVDLQLAVNTLFGVGAEAVAINGERVIATTAIRRAGQVILVNFRVLASPYVIEAVGDPVALSEGLAASQLASDFAVWTQDFGLGYGVEASDELVLPAFTGSLGLRTAVPADDLGDAG